MVTGRKWIILTAVACVALAGLAALAAVFLRQGELHIGPWLLAAGAAWVGALCLFKGETGSGLRCRNSPEGAAYERNPSPSPPPPAWCRSVAAMSLAALAPLVMESNLHGVMADAALVSLALAVAVSHAAGGAGPAAAGAVLTGVACALDATALLWPIGCAWAALARRSDRRHACVLLAAGGVGVIVATLAGWPRWTGHVHRLAVHAIHRDLTFLLPVLMLGGAGYACAWRRLRTRAGEPAPLRLTGWAGAGTLALVLALIGWPVNVRLCVLPFWWWMPVGLSDLAETSRDRRKQYQVVRFVGLLSCAVLVALSWAGVKRWLDGPLIALYLVTSNG